MKLVIAGSRDIDESIVLITIELHGLDPKSVTEVVSGTARGGDKGGELWAAKYGVPIRRFKADWDRYKKAAGPIRNEEMARYGDKALIIWDGKSRGSMNMKQQMEKLGKPCVVLTVET